MASNTVTTASGGSNASSTHDLTIDVDREVGTSSSAAVVPTHEASQSRESTIRVCLQEKELWQEFYAVGNEMIVTKPGRRMYPYVVITPYDLKPGVQYTVNLRIIPADNKRYKYASGVWHAVGGSDAIVDATRMSFKHPTTPALGEHLNGNPLIFKHAKLTHVRDNKEHILIRTMHKYMAVIDVTEIGENVMETSTFAFTETTFIAVTSYLSSQLTSLKIRHNPFARGIQDRAQLSITNGDSTDFRNENNDVLPPIMDTGNPSSSLQTANVTIPHLPLVPAPSQHNSSGYASSSSLPPTLTVPQIFAYTSASTPTRASTSVSAPSLLQQDSSCGLASGFISTLTLPPHHIPVPSLPFCPPITQDAPPRLPQWPSSMPSTSLIPITNYITTPGGRRQMYSHVSWPYPQPLIPPQPPRRLPYTESFKITPGFHPYFPYPSAAAAAATPFYPRPAMPHYPVYFNPNYNPNFNPNHRPNQQ